MKSLIRYTRRSSGGWQVFVNDRCLGTLVDGIHGKRWAAMTKNHPFENGEADTRDEAAALLPGFKHNLALAKAAELKRMAQELMMHDMDLFDYWNSYANTEPDEDDKRHDIVEGIGHRFLDLMDVPRK